MRASPRSSCLLVALFLCGPAFAADVALDERPRILSASNPELGNEVKGVSLAIAPDGFPVAAIHQRLRGGEEIVDWKLESGSGRAPAVLKGKLEIGGDERIPLFVRPSGEMVAGAFARDRKGKPLVFGGVDRKKQMFAMADPGGTAGKVNRECLEAIAGPDWLVYYAFVQEAQGGNGDLYVGLASTEPEVAPEIPGAPPPPRVGAFVVAEADRRVCPCCRPALATLPDGTILLAYRDESEADVRDIYLRRVSVEPRSPSKPFAIEAAARVSPEGWKAKQCPMAGPSVVALDEHAVLVAYVVPGGPHGQPSKIKVARSIDGGKSFSGAPVEATAGRKPTLLATGEQGGLALVYEGEPDGIFVTVSRDGGLTWGAPARVDEAKKGTTARAPAAVADRQQNAMYVAWIETQGKTRSAMLRRAALRGCE